MAKLMLLVNLVKVARLREILSWEGLKSVMVSIPMGITPNVVPVPKPKVSAQLPPVRTSFPHSPNKVSLPEPPMRVSSPKLALM